jgi:curved DNA-binding protein CbpA
MNLIIENERMSNDLKNYYEVLEISTTAKSEEVYYSYQRAKAAYSSDSLALYSLMSVDECRNVLDLVEEAYSILSDPMKRKRYDEARGINREINAMNYDILLDRVSPVRSEPVNNSVSSMLSSEFKINSQSSAPISNGDMSIKAAQTLSNTTNITKLVTQQRFALDFVLNAAFEQEIAEATEFNGEFLRKIREYKSVDLERLSDMTKISRLYLQGVESEDYDKLPAPVYVRGFVFQYAKCLKLKPEIVANSYVARMKKLKP